MYNVYDKSDVYYFCNCNTNITMLIGNKKDLIKFLASGTVTYGDERPYMWGNDFLNDINMGNDKSKTTCTRYCKGLDGNIYPEYQTYITDKQALFFDGYNRIIDVRIFKEEVLEFYKKYPNECSRLMFFKRKIKKRTKRHIRKNFRYSRYKNIRWVRKMDSMFARDEEYKDYHFKKIEDTNNLYFSYYDDGPYREVSMNWKDQYKVNKQHNIHNNGKQTKQ